MRKTILFILSLLVTSVMMAQDIPSSLGFHIGYAQPIYRLNLPTSENDNKNFLNTTSLNGLKVGVVYDQSIVKGFGFTLGLNYTYAAKQSGWNEYQYDENANPTVLHSIEYSTNYRYHQGELFIDWQYKFEIAKNTFVILYTGPTLQVAAHLATDYFRYIGDYTKPEMTKVVASFPEKQDEYLRKFNVTWGVGAGFQFDRYFLRGGYDFGMTNPYKEYTFNGLGITGDDRRTRGRLDQWQIKIGMYLWQF